MYNALKATMEYKTGPPIANLRCRSMAWQLEANWCWHIVFTDRMACLKPEYNYLEPIAEFMQTNFGSNLNEQGPNGPNT